LVVSVTVLVVRGRLVVTAQQVVAEVAVELTPGDRPRRATVVNVFRDGVRSISNEPLLEGVPVIPNGQPVRGRGVVFWWPHLILKPPAPMV